MITATLYSVNETFGNCKVTRAVQQSVNETFGNCKVTSAVKQYRLHLRSIQCDSSSCMFSCMCVLHNVLVYSFILASTARSVV